MVSDSGPSSTTLAIAEPSTPQPLAPTKHPQSNKQEPGQGSLPLGRVGKEWWRRPADSKTRKIVNKIVVMRVAGHKGPAIAKKLGTTESNIRSSMWLARKNGWLDDNDEPFDMELELALDVDRKIVRNVSASLDGAMVNWQTHEMTIAAAKGRGAFRSREKGSDDEAAVMPMVAIQIVMPTDGVDAQNKAAAEQFEGRPAFVDGETIDEGAE